ncbi:MAG: capsule biosynthesis GfcC family protein [Pseudomonadota bacterium]|jgi:hypothetical protein|nr:capsule biosynthesis GfcC family protein [Pseudomonadota bacterium]
MMKSFLTTLLVAWTTFSSVAWASEEANNLNVTLNGQTYIFERPVRLASMLSIVSDKNDWYWPASTVFDLNANDAELEREAIKAEISALLPLITRHSDKYAALGHLYRQISSWDLHTRVVMPVSYNRARLIAEENPMFQFGRYAIELNTRPKNVHVWGAVKKPQAYLHQNGTPIYTAIDEVKKGKRPDRSHVFIIDPQGNIEKKGIAYWNLDASQIMPGSQIYVPINSELFSDRIEKLNWRVAALAVNRVLPQ